MARFYSPAAGLVDIKLNKIFDGDGFFGGVSVPCGSMLLCSQPIKSSGHRSSLEFRDSTVT